MKQILLLAFLLVNITGFSQLTYSEANYELDLKMKNWAGTFYNTYKKSSLITDDIINKSNGKYKVIGSWKYKNRWWFGTTEKAKFTAWISIKGSGKIQVNKICITEHMGYNEECKDFDE